MKEGIRGTRRRKINVISLILFLALLLALDYPFLNKKVENIFGDYNKETIFVDRVIDGDTIVTGNRSIRLLGINTPERGEILYQEAKSFLEKETLGRNVSLEFVGERHDKYGRTLAYVFVNEGSINTKAVENGFANYYFYAGMDKYSDDLIDAWNSCIEKKINLCEPSQNKCSSCISLESSKVVNGCQTTCNISNWSVKGEGREKFIFSKQTIQPGSYSKFALDLTNSGGSLFLRDEKGKLVVWKR